MIALIVGGAACSSSTVVHPTTTTATSTPATNSTANLLLSACATHMSRAAVRAALERLGKTPQAVEIDLDTFDKLHC